MVRDWDKKGGREEERSKTRDEAKEIEREKRGTREGGSVKERDRGRDTRRFGEKKKQERKTEEEGKDCESREK